MIERHSSIAHNAYIDLKRIIGNEAVSDIRGCIVLWKRGGGTYVFDKYRIGEKSRKKYIGVLDEEMQRRIDRHEALKSERETRLTQRRRLARLLRGEGLRTMDAPVGSLLAALEKTGAFRLGAVLVGTVAFGFYEGELGIRLSTDYSSATLDIDIASFRRLAVGIDGHADPSLADVLKELEFEPAPDLHRRSWRWTRRKDETLVEFLTPYTAGGAERERIGALGIDAHAVRFMDYLLKDAVDAVAVYRSGVLVRVPAPERYAIHKLILAARRADDRLKAEKDRRQADLLIEILSEDRPDDLAAAFTEAMGRGDGWRRAIEQTLKRMPEAKRRLAEIA